MFLRRFLPASFRRSLRIIVDSFFCRKDLGLVRIGSGASWCIAPLLINEDSKILSGGAGNDISFEIALKDQFGCQIALFDPSPTGLATYHRTAKHFSPGNNLRYFAIGLAGTSQSMTFATPEDPNEGSFKIASEQVKDVVEFECASLHDALIHANFTTIDLLKLDIEGFEYDFLNALLETNHRPDQIAVEFHDFFPSIPFSRTLAMIRALRHAGYRIVYKKQFDYLFVHESVLSRLVDQTSKAVLQPI